MTTIRLYGKLGARFGRVHHLAVNSAAEAIRALGSQLHGFDAHLTQSKDNGVGYAVFYGKRNLAEENLHDPTGAEEIRLAPVMLGRKNGGWLQVILGAVLVVVGAAMVVASAGTMGAIGGGLMNLGWAMVIGGVVQLLTPTPKGSGAKDKPENQPSYAFNGPVNTQAQGNPVQVLYGELIVGSAVLSASINAVDHAYIPTNTAATGGGTGSGGGGGGGAPPWHMEF